MTPHQRYPDFLEYIPVGYVLLSADATILAANHVAASMLGRSQTELRGLTFGLLTASTDSSILNDYWRSVFAGDEKQSCELELLTVDDRPLPVRIESIAFSDSGKRIASAVLIDISQSLLKDRNLRQRNQTLEARVAERTREAEVLAAAMANVDEGLMITCEHGDWPSSVTLEVNDALCEISGYAREELIGQSPWVLWGNATPGLHLERLCVELAAGRSYSAELLAQRKDGQCYDVELFVMPLFDEEGRCNFVGIVRDIGVRKASERRETRMQSQLRQLVGKLASAREEEQRRIAEVLHDHVAQYLATALIKLSSSEPCKHEVEDLVTMACDKLRSLNSELANATLRRLGLGAALDDLAATMAERHGLRVQLQVHGPLAALEESLATILFKATRELLFNVVKHASVLQAKVEVSCRDGNIQVSVEDQGRGFPQPLTDEEIWIGKELGLFSIQERLRHVGGQLRIDSSPGEFSRVTMCVPKVMMR